MKISAQITWEFNRNSVARGYRLYEEGVMSLAAEPGGTVKASFGGYRISLRLEGHLLETVCTCRGFTQSHECEHIWAALLEAEDQNLLPEPDGRVKLVNRKRPDPEVFVPPPSRPQIVVPPSPKPATPNKVWQGRAHTLLRAGTSPDNVRTTWPSNRLIFYKVRIQTQTDYELHISATYADPRKSGAGLNKARPLQMTHWQIESVPDPVDREILIALYGARESSSFFRGEAPASSWSLHPAMARALLPKMCATGRCFIDGGGDLPDGVPLVWETEPWQFSLAVKKKSGRYAVSGVFTRGSETKAVSDPILVVGGSLLFTFNAAASIQNNASPDWITNLRNHGAIYSSEEEWDELASALIEMHLPTGNLPEDLQAEELRIGPVPCLRIETRETGYRTEAEDLAMLLFDYGDVHVRTGDLRRGILQPGKKLILRDPEAERRAVERMEHFRLPAAPLDVNGRPQGWYVAPEKLGKMVFQLSRDGWRIDLRGKKVVQPSNTTLDVSSGIDWFDLDATVSYGEHRYSYPQLLKALDLGGATLILPNGDLGVAPAEWIAQMARLAALGKTQGDKIRFGANQAGLLDVLLADRPEASFDETFEKARQRMQAFEGIQAAPQPEGFTGQLRDYQREGIGWMQFLQEFGFGGCLADDMGVGKTAQVLALLETRRVRRREPDSNVLPSIVVVPRSLVFNWKQEAARFTPDLRILDHTTPDRNLNEITKHDLIIVTYGTLRRDIVDLRDIQFDYAILDEAQAIKNAASDSAKASRLLDAKYRLVLSGTPVQNSLSDLWSLFQFLNPGMLGTAGAFKAAGGSVKEPDEQTRLVLSKALRPLILRRTKEQVASELPPKSESILHCEMEGDQRKLYDELREHYRRSLLGTVDVNGLGKARMQVLEALLRLRQAACHPGLIDKTRIDEPSAKLEVLLSRLTEVMQEGHKALVFSQFTSFLDIVRRRLDKDKVRYEYLDGGTTDRQAHVENFENDPDTKLFLISLKAGGVGLNLVSADYVFLLDPWWNPAVEAQAIDRTHRIGQTRHVFAYRLIATDTVEEKVLALQDKKRKLADAVISQDNSLLAEMGREELEFLLS